MEFAVNEVNRLRGADPIDRSAPKTHVRNVLFIFWRNFLVRRFKMRQ